MDKAFKTRAETKRLKKKGRVRENYCSKICSAKKKQDIYLHGKH